jgi:hypothetical protein
MRILAIDPGHTTGWCQIDPIGNRPFYVFSGNFNRANIEHAVRHLLNPPIFALVIERLPNSLPPVMSGIKNDLEKALQSVLSFNVVAPAEWKPITGRYPLPRLNWRMSQHERDAWRMGVFWLWKEGLIKI